MTEGSVLFCGAVCKSVLGRNMCRWSASQDVGNTMKMACKKGYEEPLW